MYPSLFSCFNFYKIARSCSEHVKYGLVFSCLPMLFKHFLVGMYQCLYVFCINNLALYKCVVTIILIILIIIIIIIIIIVIIIIIIIRIIIRIIIIRTTTTTTTTIIIK